MAVVERAEQTREDEAPIPWLIPHAQEVVSLPEQIATKIGNRILSGSLEPGARITEQVVADEFGVSRGPIRDAFRILERERLVDNNPRRGVTVSVLSPSDLGEIFEIASVLTDLAIRRVAVHASPEAVQALDQAIAEVEPVLGDPAAASQIAVVAFRSGMDLIRLAGSRRLEHIVGTLLLEAYRHRRLMYRSDAFRKGLVARWRKLRTAIKKGDPEAASQAWKQIFVADRQKVEDTPLDS